MQRLPDPPTPATKLLLSWSGGKDSALALHTLQQDAGYEVVGLLTSVTTGYNRVSIHGVRRSLLDAQAERLDLPLHVIELDQTTSNDQYEAAFLDGLSAAAREHADTTHIAFGDLFLEDVRAYRERLLATSPWTPVFPLWGLDTAALATRFVDDGFRARLVCVDSMQLDGEFCGREFDRTFLRALSPTVDPCGERGEFHTFVSDGPVFQRAVNYTVGERILRDGRFMYCDLVEEAETPLDLPR